MALAIDGTVWNSTSGSSLILSSFSTSNANDVIILIIDTLNSAPTAAPTVSSVSGGGLTWFKRHATGSQTIDSGSITCNLEIWYAVSSSALSSVNISITFSASGSTVNGTLFGISGANTSIPFDTNSSLPASATSLNSSSAPSISGVSTNNPNTFAFSFTEASGSVSHTTTWVSIIGLPREPISQYQIQSFLLSNATITYAGSNQTGFGYVALVDAVQAAPIPVSGIGSISGNATVSGIGSAGKSAQGTISGSATVSGATAATKSAAGTIVGSATVIGLVPTPGVSTGTITGSAIVSGGGRGIPPSIPPLSQTTVQNVIYSYLYEQYRDDFDLQSSREAYNQIAQGYLDSFNNLNLPIYTNLTDAMLDWVGTNLYGYERPTLSFGQTINIGAYNTFAFDQIAINGSETQTINGGSYIVNDDIYKRCLTWHFFKGDGKAFNIPWLKRRIHRFLNGPNGAYFNVDNTYDVSVPVGTAGSVLGSFVLGFSVLGGVSAEGQIILSNTSIAQTFQAAVHSGVLELPFQNTWTVTLV